MFRRRYLVSKMSRGRNGASESSITT